jgi:hypothetical protein
LFDKDSLPLSTSFLDVFPYKKLPLDLRGIPDTSPAGQRTKVWKTTSFGGIHDQSSSDSLSRAARRNAWGGARYISERNDGHSEYTEYIDAEYAGPEQYFEHIKPKHNIHN